MSGRRSRRNCCLGEAPDDRREAPAASGEPVIWLLVVVFIVYGSLYPFRFHALGDGPGSVRYLLTTWQRWDHPSDLLANILLYMPFGFFGSHVLPPRLGSPVRWVGTLVGGVLLSTAVELTQFYDAGRDSTLGDVYANAIGTAVGVCAAGFLGFGQRWEGLRALGADKTAAALLVAWFAYRLYPYVPTINWHKYLHAVEAVATDPLPGPLECARFLLAWLLVATIVGKLYTARHRHLVFAALVSTELLGRVLILDATVSVKDLAGAAGAFLVWNLVPGFRAKRPQRLAVAMAAMVVAERLAPFQFAAEPLRGFGWIPALSLMQGSVSVAVQAFCEKVFTYGGLIWLMWRSGVGLSSATVWVAAMLAGTSYAQTFLPARSAEITDAALALLIGGIAALSGGPPRETSPPVTSAPGILSDTASPPGSTEQAASR